SAKARSGGGNGPRIDVKAGGPTPPGKIAIAIFRLPCQGEARAPRGWRLKDRLAGRLPIRGEGLETFVRERMFDQLLEDRRRHRRDVRPRERAVRDVERRAD